VRQAQAVAVELCGVIVPIILYLTGLYR